MWDKLRNLLKKHWDLVLYLVFGVLTTAVDYLVYFLLSHCTDMLASVCNVIAWVAAVAFAYVTNKPFVFKSHDWSASVLLPELGKFVGSRALSGALQTLLILLTTDICGLNGDIMKLVTSAVVIVLNYIASKLFVFRKKKEA